MPEPENIVYTHKELTELMLRDQDIRSGNWAIYIRFRFQAVNLEVAETDFKPAAIAFVETIGIQRVDQPFPLTVDASKLAKPAATRPRHRPKSSVAA